MFLNLAFDDFINQELQFPFVGLFSLQKFVWKLICFAFAGSIHLFFLGIFSADEDILIRACLQDAYTVTGVSQASEKLWEAELEF